MKVKIITGHIHSIIESSVNKFIDDDNIKVIDIKYQENGHVITALIMYVMINKS